MYVNVLGRTICDWHCLGIAEIEVDCQDMVTNGIEFAEMFWGRRFVTELAWDCTNWSWISSYGQKSHWNKGVQRECSLWLTLPGIAQIEVDLRKMVRNVTENMFSWYFPFVTDMTEIAQIEAEFQAMVRNRTENL